MIPPALAPWLFKPAAKFVGAGIFVAVLAALLAGIYCYGKAAGTHACEMKQATAETAQVIESAALDKQQTKDVAQVEIRYVERIVEVEKRVPVVRDRVVRVCEQALQVRSGAGVPEVPGLRDGAAGADANDRRDYLDQLGAELLACRRNSELHKALRDTAIANGALKP